MYSVTTRPSRKKCVFRGRRRRRLRRDLCRCYGVFHLFHLISFVVSAGNRYNRTDDNIRGSLSARTPEITTIIIVLLPNPLQSSRSDNILTRVVIPWPL